MADKTPLHVVLQKIQSGLINDDEADKFFRIAPNPDKPFDFNIGINTDAVDVTNAPSANSLAGPLLRDAGIALDLQKLAPKAPSATFKRELPLIAEGDSWFKLPDVAVAPFALIAFLQKKYSIVNLAHWGDELSDMILKGQFWPFLQSGKSDVLLFSGGGNDILGGGMLAQFLELFDVDHTKPADAAFYLKAEFFDNLNVVMGRYENLIAQVKLRAPHVTVLAHGYDYVIPRTNGPWLGVPLTNQGFDLITRSDLCEAIIAAMIDAFNSRLSALEQAHPVNFKFVDLRGTVKADEWWDELHPLEVGAKKTAAKFAKALEALPAADEVVASPFDAHVDRLRVA